jgi:hypothetical protein
MQKDLSIYEFAEMVAEKSNEKLLNVRFVDYMT